MKHILFAITLLAIVSLAACTMSASTLAQPTDTKTTTVSLDDPDTLTITPAQTTASNTAQETAIRDLVENFGKRLQTVSLLAPDAAEEMQKQYSDLVSPALLEIWMKDTSKAPGRMVSSPWPDRIEITTLSKSGSDRYEITGFVVEITSVEVVNGGAAIKIPVRVVVQKAQGRWFITEYAEEQ